MSGARGRDRLRRAEEAFFLVKAAATHHVGYSGSRRARAHCFAVACRVALPAAQNVTSALAHPSSPPPLSRAPRAEWAVATRSLLFTVPIGTALHKDIVLLLMLSGRDLIL